MFCSINFLGIFRGLSIMTFGLFVNCAVSAMIAGRKKLVDFKESAERRAYIFFWMYMISLTLYVGTYAADFGADSLISGTAAENLKFCSAVIISVSAYVFAAALISLWKLFFRRKRKSDGRDIFWLKCSTVLSGVGIVGMCVSLMLISCCSMA